MRTRRYALAVLLALVFAAPFAAQTPAQTPAPAPGSLDQATLTRRLDEYVTAHQKVNDFSGTVLLAKDGKPLFVKGYGYANREWQIPNAADTKFRIGSITKQFTSMLIMQLREQGKVKLEDSVCDYVARCPDTWKPVTIHHLLTHTSGIPSYTSLAAWRVKNMVPHTPDQVIDYVRDLPLQWVPGEQYAYNNSGYFLLGLVIEKAAGKKYETALQDMLLGPLDLTDTGYDWSHTIIQKRASGYEGRGTAVRNTEALDMQQPYAAGSMYSTVLDLLKWEQMLYSEKLIPEAAKKIMWTPFRNNYAYGWNIAAPQAATFGHLRIAHSGGINGFSANLTRVPELRLTSIVLTNNETSNASLVARDLLAIYYNQPVQIPVAK